MLTRLITSLPGTLLALLLGGALPSLAAETAVRAPSPGAHDRGVLWKIERAGQPPSYLFGTVHVADPRITDLPAPVNQAFEKANHLMMEVVVDATAIIQLSDAMYFKDGRTLEKVIGNRLYADVRAAFVKRGLPTELLGQYKPWAASMLLSLPPQSGAPPLDLQLQLRAAQLGKPVDGLETIQEQIAVFDELGMEEQRALLEATLREQGTLDAQIEALLQAYLARDLARLQKLLEQQTPGDAALRATVTRRLLTDRNHRMVERLRPHLKRGNAFIAVGVAHLPGPGGMLELLEREGYRVHAVY